MLERKLDQNIYIDIHNLSNKFLHMRVIRCAYVKIYCCMSFPKITYTKYSRGIASLDEKNIDHKDRKRVREIAYDIACSIASFSRVDLR